jgi:lysophospholipase L1-like esterase
MRKIPQMGDLSRRQFLAAGAGAVSSFGLRSPGGGLRSAIQRARQGQFASIAFIGDSTTRGQGAGKHRDMYLHSYPAQASRLFARKGMVSTCQNVFGSGGKTDVFLADSRMSKTGRWDFAGPQVIGGTAFHATSAGLLKFEPLNCDRCDVWYVDQGGSFAVNGERFDSQVGGALRTITAAGSSVEVQWLSGNVSIAAFRAYSKPTLECWNWGRGGSRSRSWADDRFAWSPLSALARYAPDAFVIDLGVNDWHGRHSLEGYEADMRSLIVACMKVGEVVLKTPVPSAETVCPLIVQQKYVDIVRSLAHVFSLTLIDVWGAWGSYEARRGLYHDGMHPNEDGYAQEAELVVASLLAA